MTLNWRPYWIDGNSIFVQLCLLLKDVKAYQVWLVYLQWYRLHRVNCVDEGLLGGHLGLTAILKCYFSFWWAVVFRASKWTYEPSFKAVSWKLRFPDLLRSKWRPPSWNNGRLHTNPRWVHIQFWSAHRILPVCQISYHQPDANNYFPFRPDYDLQWAPRHLWVGYFGYATEHGVRAFACFTVLRVSLSRRHLGRGGGRV